VSHVRVTSYSNPHNDYTGMNEVSYGVEYLTVYKQPNSTTTLPSSIFTSSNEALCGISMEVGKEYLLTGGEIMTC
ncbi:hypothetical protein Angca_007164, partial [Angiostrongylus cantonensis]